MKTKPKSLSNFRLNRQTRYTVDRLSFSDLRGHEIQEFASGRTATEAVERARQRILVRACPIEREAVEKAMRTGNLRLRHVTPGQTTLLDDNLQISLA